MFVFFASDANLFPLKTPDPYGLKIGIPSSSSETCMSSVPIPIPNHNQLFQVPERRNSTSILSSCSSYFPIDATTHHQYQYNKSHQNVGNHSINIPSSSSNQLCSARASSYTHVPYYQPTTANVTNVAPRLFTDATLRSSDQQMPPPVANPMPQRRSYNPVDRGSIQSTRPETFRTLKDAKMELSPFYLSQEGIQSDDKNVIESSSPLMRALIIPPEMDHSISPYFEKVTVNSTAPESHKSCEETSKVFSHIESQDVGTSPICFDEAKPKPNDRIEQVTKSKKKKISTTEQESSSYFSSSDMCVEEVSPILKVKDFSEEESDFSLPSIRSSPVVVAHKIEDMGNPVPCTKDGTQTSMNLMESKEETNYYDEKLDHEEKETNPSIQKNQLPPLCDILPSKVDRSRDSTWSDSMWREAEDLNTSSRNISTEDVEAVCDWGEDWDCSLVTDDNGLDWLKTEDHSGKTLYISLTTGDASYDMKTPIDMKKLSASQAEKLNTKRYLNALNICIHFYYE